MSEPLSPVAGVRPGAEIPAGPHVTAALQPLPEVEPLDMDKVMLGRRLFHDTRLSADHTVSCASCHSLDRAGTDGERVSTGIRGQLGSINSPTVLNARFNIAQFWDGRAANLFEQAGGPITNAVEMGNTWDHVIATVRADPSYARMFAHSYPAGVTSETVRDAIVTYEMTLVTPSPVDRYLRGDATALTAEEREGADTFGAVGCTTCHSGVNVGGGMFMRMGVVEDYFSTRGGPVTQADWGRYNVTHRESDRYTFRVPTLRNVAGTAPYFHDGYAPDLDSAIRLMGRHQLGRELSGLQVERIRAFLRALTGNIPDDARMPLEPIPSPSAHAPRAFPPRV